MTDLALQPSVPRMSAATLAAFGARHSHWLLRVSLASVYLYHGITKLPALEAVGAMLGLPAAIVLLVALGEVGGSVLILAGGVVRDRLGDVLTRLGVITLTPIIVGAIMLVHWGQWSFVASATHPMGGAEFQVTLLLMQLYLLAIPRGLGRVG